jgi:hypothetical protein
MGSGLAQAIHIAACRYCADEAARWRAEPWIGGTEAHTLPRFLVLRAILAELEALPPDQFASEHEARDLLALAGEIAEDGMTRHWARRSTIAAEVMREERERFVAYVRRVSASDLAKIEPPPAPDPWWYALVPKMQGEPRTRHYLGVHLMPTAAVLILQPPRKRDGGGVFLVRYATDGTFAGDTWHFNFEEARGQAEFEYPEVELEWHEIPKNVEDPTAYAIERIARQP